MKMTNPTLSKAILLLPVALFAGACTQGYSSRSYDSHAVGQVRRVERGTIESFRWVEIRKNTGVGTVAGAGIGAAAGSTVGNSGAENVIGAIGGALIGGLIGSGIEKSGSKRSGYEYIIRTESGNLVTLVQEDDHPLPDGAPVIIIFSGDRARVTLDHNAYRAPQDQNGGSSYYEQAPQNDEGYYVDEDKQDEGSDDEGTAENPN